MVKSVLLFALCLLPAMAIAHRHNMWTSPLVLEGKVLCDTCLTSFETPASTPVAGATVEVACRERADPSKIKYSKRATTNEEGCYKMSINEQHVTDFCDVKVIASGQTECAKPVAGRESARVILTRNNGMSSDSRYANTLMLAVQSLNSLSRASCKRIMQQYQLEVEGQY